MHQIIEKHIDETTERQKVGNCERPLIEESRKTILLDDLVEAGIPRVEIRDQVLGVLFPARDATALGISNVFFFLARHPEVLQKLRSEILPID